MKIQEWKEDKRERKEKEGTQRGGRKGGRKEKGLKEENTERKGGKIRQRREARLQHAGLRERETPAEGASIPRRPRGAPRAAPKGLSPRKCTTLWGGRGDGAGKHGLCVFPLHQPGLLRT